MADVLDLPTSRIHAWARQGLLQPARGPRDEHVFSFQDLAVLRSAQELLDADVSLRRVHHALVRLQEILPAGRPLSAVQLTALGGRVLVREGRRLWDPDSGQLQMGLSPDRRADAQGPSVHSLVEAAAGAEVGRTTWKRRTADDWFHRGVELEGTDEAGARAAYRRALEEDPAFADAYVNLGRLLHEDGALDEAELQYRAALASRRDHARAWYNLGVLLEDREREEEALEAYEAALAADSALAVAHWNAARLHERARQDAEALRHLTSYKKLVEGRGFGV